MRRCHGQGNQRGPQWQGALDFGRAPNPCVPHRGWYAEQLVSLFVDLVPFSGSDLQECDGLLTHSVCDQIFTRPLHWPNAADLPKGAMHVINFGAGGISGIGPLTARNLDGRGVRVIVIGEKGRGDVPFRSCYLWSGVMPFRACK